MDGLICFLVIGGLVFLYSIVLYAGANLHEMRQARRKAELFDKQWAEIVKVLQDHR